MQPRPDHGKGRRAAGRQSFIRVRLLWVIGGFCVLTLGLLAAPVPVNAPTNYPIWWFSRGVITPLNPANNTPSWPSSYPASDDYAAINEGQLKNFATQAFNELQAGAPSYVWSTTQGTNLATMVESWSPTASGEDDYKAINLGQLKNVAKPFYDVLIEMGYANSYPWTGNTDDYTAVNIGQVKNVFSFDLSPDPSGTGLAQWWELKYFGQFGLDPGFVPNGNGFDLEEDYNGGADPTNYYSQPGSSGQVLIVPTVTIVSGNNQSSPAGSFVPLPLAVQVSDSSGTCTNAPVTFAVTSGGGLLSTTNSGTAPLSTSVTVLTNSSGQAQVYFQQPTGDLTSQITVTAGSGTPAVFSENNTNWLSYYSTEVQNEITLHQWTQAQANNYVTLEQNNPNMLTHGLSLWLRADAASSLTTTNNGGVTSVMGWADQTGNYAVSQLTATNNQPTYIANDVNGLPAVRFNGSQWLSGLGATLAPGLNHDMTMIVVGATTNTATQSYSFYLGQDNGTAGINRATGYNSNHEYFDTAGTSGSATGGSAVSGNFVTEITTLDSTLTHVTFYQNGVQTVTNTISAAQNLSAGITCGAAPGGTNGWQGDIAEVLVYDHQLSSSEIAQVDGYLADKYGLDDPNGTWQLGYSDASTNTTNSYYGDVTNGDNLQALISTYHWDEAQAQAYADTPLPPITTATNGADLVLWLKADAASSLTTTNNGTSTNAICGWADQSGYGNNAMQSTSSYQPVLEPTGLSGHPCLYFNGSNYLTINDNSNGSMRPGAITVFAVAQDAEVGSEADDQALISRPYYGSGNWRNPYVSYDMSLTGDDDNQLRNVVVTTTNSVWSKVEGGQSFFQANTTYQFTWEYDGTNSQNVYWDGTAEDTYYSSASPSGPIQYPNSLHTCIGNVTDVNYTNYWESLDGRVAEILVYNGALNNTDRQFVEAYLADKYGLSYPNASWPMAYSSEVQAAIATYGWNQAQADAYVALLAATPPTPSPPAQPPPCVPPDGLALWFRADKGVYSPSGTTATNGGAVATWQDQTPFGNTVSQGSTNDQPQFVSNAVNGEPGIQFNGSTQYLIRSGYAGLSTGTNDRTVFVVAEYSNNPSDTWSGGLSYGTTNNEAAFSVGLADHENGDSMDVDNWDHAKGFGGVILSKDYLDECAVLQNEGLTPYENGQTVLSPPNITSTAQHFDTSANGNIVLGASLALGTTFVAQTDCEIIAYNRALSSTEQAQVDGYLADKYGYYSPNAAWPMAYSGTNTSTDVQALIQANNWNIEQANAYVASETASQQPVPADGLVMWLRADEGVYASGNLSATNGGPVETWQDQSGYGNNAIQFNLTNQPTYGEKAINGKPVINFNGLTDFMHVIDNANLRSNNVTVLAVVNAQPQLFSTQYTSIISKPYYPGTWSSPYCAYSVELSPSINPYFQYAVGDSLTYTPTAQALNPGRAVLLTSIFNSTNGSIDENDASSQTATASGPLNYGSTNEDLTIGANLSMITTTNSADGEYNGQIAEVLIYNHALSSSDLAQAENYLINKYGLNDPLYDGQNDPLYGDWILAYTAEQQAEIEMNQWDEDQANNYVALENAYPNMPTHGLVLWLKADSGVYAPSGVSATNEDSVGSWVDQTGNYTVSQATSANQPTYSNTVINGMPALQFCGDQWLSNPSNLNLNADLTIIQVSSTSNLTTVLEDALWLGSGGEGYNRGFGYYQDSPDSQYFDTNGIGTKGTVVPSANTFVAEAVSLNSTRTGVTFYRDGSQVETGTLSGVQNLTPGITAGAVGGGGHPWYGDIAEVMVYDHQLSASEMQQVSLYLANKYNISYYGAAPTISPAGGNYTTTQTVTITSSLPSGNSIYYTLDGTPPATSSSASVSTSTQVEITVPSSALVQAVVLSPTGLVLSQTGSEQFYINDSGDTGLPPALTGLTATAIAPTQIYLSWTAPTGLLTYNEVDVYRSTNGGPYDLIAVQSATAASTYTDTNVTPGNTYSYEIGTVNQAGMTDSSSSSATSSAGGAITITVTVPSGAAPWPP